jgi:hypothetical protein
VMGFTVARRERGEGREEMEMEREAAEGEERRSTLEVERNGDGEGGRLLRHSRTRSTQESWPCEVEASSSSIHRHDDDSGKPSGKGTLLPLIGGRSQRASPPPRRRQWKPEQESNALPSHSQTVAESISTSTTTTMETRAGKERSSLSLADGRKGHLHFHDDDNGTLSRKGTLFSFIGRRLQRTSLPPRRRQWKTEQERNALPSYSQTVAEGISTSTTTTMETRAGMERSSLSPADGRGGISTSTTTTMEHRAGR